jgi:hypothetical protein
MNAARRPAENTRVVLAIAVALWAASAALGGALGAFANLGPRLGASVIAFATAFAVATYYLDRGVRATVDAIDTRTLAVFVAAGLAAIAWIFLEGVSFGALTRMPRILVPLFVAPVTIAMQVALLDRILRAHPRRDALSDKTRKPRGNHATAI